MSQSPLVGLPVEGFVEALASTETPVPAGGSAVALSGACAAALLVLVCRVSLAHGADELRGPLAEADQLRARLLTLVDEDAEAFRAFLTTERGSDARRAAVGRVAEVPLAIGDACVTLGQLSASVEPHATRSVLGDVRAARHLAQAGVRTAVDLAEQNLSLIKDDAARRAIEARIGNLRASLTA